MASKRENENAGSGLDKPDPKGVVEKIRDAIKPKASAPKSNKPEASGS
jgi:hypothetical protein